MAKYLENQIVVIGAGTAGIMTAAQLLQKDKNLDVAIIDPAKMHYYQPAWTLVGAGTFDVAETARPMKEVLPPRATFINAAVAGIDPDKKTVTTNDDRVIQYQFLVVAPGLQIDWHKVKGLPETLNQNGVCSNYQYDSAPYTWKVLRQLKKGNAIFTQPNTPVKCGGAPQKIMYLSDEALRRNGVRQDVHIRFFSPGGVVFGVEIFSKTLEKIIGERNIDFNFKHNLVEVKGTEKIAVFDVTDPDGKINRKEVEFEMLHVVPPMSAPDFIKSSPLAAPDGPNKGWAEVDIHTLQHKRYTDVFALGDVAALPTAKTGAAIRKQVPVVVENIMTLMQDMPMAENPVYNGYSSCPLVTGYGKLVMAEFRYDNIPEPSFTFDTTQERFDMYVLKKFGLPWMYWNLMLRGKM